MTRLPSVFLRVPPWLPLFAVLIARGSFAAETAPGAHKFAFGSGDAAPGFVRVARETLYDRERGYGFEPGGSEALFKFSVAVSEGNHRVTVTLGDTAAATTTVKAETRRLMVERVATAAGEFARRTFTVNTRTPAMPPGNVLKLDTREWNPATNSAASATWDDKLTLQFSGEHPSVAAIEVEPADDAVTVFLVGDSTVTDQANEPYGGWGQQLPRWFKPSVAIANHAEHGETVKAFRAQRRWDKVMLQLKAGDYVFLQFGHNDLNRTGHDGIWPREDTMGDWAFTHAEANTDYKWILAAYAVEVRRRGGIPVIVSPMTKLNLRTGELNRAGLGDYPQAAAAAAQLAEAAFIDLNALSIEIATALGAAAPQAYVDGLHTNTYGAYLLARAITTGIRRLGLPLAAQLVDDADFDPRHPAPRPEDFRVPLEPAPPRPAGRGRGAGATEATASPKTGAAPRN